MVLTADPQIDEILNLYITEINREKPNLLEGLYLYGSIALGQYSLKLSDIDFIAVTRKRLSETEIKLFDQVHSTVELQYKKPNLNGIYVTWNDLGKLQEEILPYPYYHEGRMYMSGFFELNSVTWYELMHCGIRIVGPEISELNLAVDLKLLISNMHENMNSYWNSWIDRSTKFFSPLSWGLYFSRRGIEWGVLGITRQFYTFREKKITTKIGAGEYAMQVVPEQWHKMRSTSWALYTHIGWRDA